ncbi:MAG: Glutamate-tRNA ligase [Parcubacteria group bacterium GW2011_GWF2_45_11]|nr:MAG: Glutamate-tRNA ligase [Parcubacteria group bacterium GW2011_GWF2_45_11]
MIKTRFAPSPTGYLHIGGLRGALYPYLFAKQHKGKFVLRLEDTDQSRYVKGAVENIIQTLQKIGLEWDEGPYLDKTLNIKQKGRFGPYFQSQRLPIYQQYAQKLIDSGQAYYCFCSTDRLEKLRQLQQGQNQPSKYDGCCRRLTEKYKSAKFKIQNSKLLVNDRPAVIRLKIPQSGEVRFNDLIRGEVKIQMEDIDDQVLIKSDGFPTYHLAVVIDDHLMGITHVIRGEEWISSTPKHILLYQFLNWDLPKFAHLPLLLNKDRSKLSKRQGDVAAEDYLKKGYLPEALLNYVALLGWHPSDDRELFRLKELIKNFDLSRVQKAGAIFDSDKLNWFNCFYIKNKPDKELLRLAKKFLPDVPDKLLDKILKVEKSRLSYLAEICDRAGYFLNLADYEPEILIFKKSDGGTARLALEKVMDRLNGLKKWQPEKIKQALAAVVQENRLTNGDVFWPVRVALSGLKQSPPPEEIMAVLEKDESLTRIQSALDKLKK